MATIGSLEELEVKQRTAFTLHNATDEEQVCQYGGRYYRFPSKENTDVGDLIKFRRYKGRGGRWVTESFVDKGCEAINVAKGVLERLGHLGVTAVYEDGQDDERIKTARQAWIQTRVKRAKVAQAEWLRICAIAAADPDSTPPVQPERIKEALEFLTAYESGALEQRKRYISRVDATESDKKEDILKHHRKLYPKTAIHPEDYVIDTQGADAEPQAPVEMAPAEATAEAKPNPDAQMLLAEAETAGVNIKKDELVGLLRGEQAVFEEILEKVSMATVKKQKGGK
jgi:hypothetical protein